MDNRKRFQQGVDCIFQNWSALQIPVNSGFVEEANEKFLWFKETIVKYFGTDGGKLDRDDIEIVLEDIMLEEFNTSVEDGSIQQVAAILTSLYKDIIKGQSVVLNKLLETKQVKVVHTKLNSESESESEAFSDDSDKMQEK